MTEWWKGLLAAVLATASGSCLADSVSWQSVTADSELQFVAYYEEQALKGHFSAFSVAVAVDENNEFPLSLQVLVDVASADMNDRDVNSELGQADWFNSSAFPQAIFASDELVQTDKERYIARGALSLKGVSQDLEVPFTWRRNSGTASLTGSMEMSRLAWKIGSGEWAETDVISDTVQLNFTVTLEPVD